MLYLHVVPPCSLVKVVHLILKSLQCNFEVCYVIRRLKHAKSTGVDRGVGVINIAYLKTHLEAPSSLVSTQLYPDFILGYPPFVPG